MPILKHAKKKLKQDKKRALQNKKVKNTFKDAVKKARATKSAKTVNIAFKAVDKAVKANLIHKNKAARIKSSLSKLFGGTGAKAKSKVEKNPTKKVAAKPKTAPKTAGKKTSPKKSK